MAGPTDQSVATREIPALSMRAEFRPGSIDVEKRTAEVIWTTGARVKRGFWEPYWEELSLDPKHVRMDRLNNGAPLLSAHNGYELGAVLGVVESAGLQKKQGVATVRFAKAEDNPDAEKAFRMVKDGILQNISVGYRVHKLEQIEDGRARDDKTPVLLATDWEPYELSVVPMGADDGAGFRSSETRTPNPCVVVTHKEKSMADEKKPETAPAVDPTERLVAEAREQNARAAEVTAAESARAAEKAAAAERERIAEITSIVRSTSAQTGLGDDFAEKLIRSGTTVDKVREIVLRELARKDDASPISSHLGIQAGDDRRDKFIRGAVASIIERSGHADMIEQAKQNKRVGKYLADVASDAGELRGMRLADLARRSLEVAGDPMAHRLHGEQLVKRALEFRADQGMNTSSDFTILLETVVNKIFLGQYALIPVTWPLWCARKSVQDFRTATFYRPGTFGTLDSVSESGEIKHKNIPDGAKSTISAATKANIIGITRKALVNDDLGAFRDLAAGLGLAAAFTIEKDAWALITANSGLGATMSDTKAVFDAAHSNIGPTGAMSVATLDGARAKMALQKDSSGNQYLALRPHCWLGPVELGGQIKVFNASASDPTDSKNSGVANRVKGLFADDRIIDSPYLSASSASRHYLLADPALYPVFAVGFIDGQEAPRIESATQFNYDGVQMRVILDYGTAVIDYRGAVTCAGA